MMGSVCDLGEEAVVERVQDQDIQLLGLLPDFLEHAGKDVGAPLLTGDDDLAAELVEGADAVPGGLLGGLLRARIRRSLAQLLRGLSGDLRNFYWSIHTRGFIRAHRCRILNRFIFAQYLIQQTHYNLNLSFVLQCV
jgi:hypothetical protein